MDKPKGCSPDQVPNDPSLQTPITQPKSDMPSKSIQSEHTSWREVAAMAARESDPQRLAHLVDELIRLLDEERRGKGLRPFEKNGM